MTFESKRLDLIRSLKTLLHDNMPFQGSYLSFTTEAGRKCHKRKEKKSEKLLHSIGLRKKIYKA